jgi:hypothetical protein
MYKFKVLKSGAISVYKDNNLCCIIPSDFSLIRDDVYMVFYGGAMVSSGSLIGNNKKITLLIR